MPPEYSVGFLKGSVKGSAKGPTTGSGFKVVYGSRFKVSIFGVRHLLGPLFGGRSAQAQGGPRSAAAASSCLLARRHGGARDDPLVKWLHSRQCTSERAPRALCETAREQQPDVGVLGGGMQAADAGKDRALGV